MVCRALYSFVSQELRSPYRHVRYACLDYGILGVQRSRYALYWHLQNDCITWSSQEDLGYGRHSVTGVFGMSATPTISVSRSAPASLTTKCTALIGRVGLPRQRRHVMADLRALAQPHY